ncbi:hypothetical protein GON03_12005 [Nocardioides sp. MAH-18]|uniref:Uncharacterized protein n=1 Tax=Nocardioides agri TaxID=2682843 RepID=A0A6L6XRU6_9ACTN|nr:MULTISPECIES: hypothetical protein [unclassified Nocardioides]MBA2955056.1 hypothetical protein [Nocardioides sp. CGMCC 1.13656]MVQ49910.1 hypothetical protein [Nocardioides sp. MAH-18]
MNDPDDAVRRLLAEARHAEPLPDDVAARLDDVLADLRAEGPPPAVVDLAAARRRRTRLRNGLVAAAAVVLVGFGISRVDLSGMSTDSSDAGGSADSAARESAAAPAAPSPLDGDAQAEGQLDGQGLASLGPVVRLRSDRLEQQVQRLVAASAAGSDQGRSADEVDECPAPSGPGRSLAATYDGAPAVLVLRPPAGGVRVADVYLCGESTPVRSVSVPVG